MTSIPSLGMFQNVIAGMKEKTGRTLEEWIQFVNKEGPATEKETRRIKLLPQIYADKTQIRK